MTRQEFLTLQLAALDALVEVTTAAAAQAHALEHFLKAAEFPMVPP